MGRLGSSSLVHLKAAGLFPDGFFIHVSGTSVPRGVFSSSFFLHNTLFSLPVAFHPLGPLHVPRFICLFVCLLALQHSGLRVGTLLTQGLAFKEQEVEAAKPVKAYAQNNLSITSVEFYW